MTKKMVRLPEESKKELDDLVKEENSKRAPELKEATQEWMLKSIIRNAWLEINSESKND